MSHRLWSGILLLFLVALAFLSAHRHRAPEPVGAGAPATEFSAERALEHIKVIGQQPHAAGTPACAAVGRYIIDTLERMDVTPEIQEAFENRCPGRVSTVRNILARIPGKANTKAVALMAHYDSVPFGPGAADDGSGVAALLEATRAIKAGPPLNNDIILIFTDGEEGNQPLMGRRGAYAFAAQHPWMADIGAVFNFDARGTHGPSYMYETSPNNGWLIAQMARSGCRPVATSFMADISRRSPTGSDFSVLAEHGIKGLDFAFIQGLARYHTALDTPENLSLRSLQHHGLYALRLAQRFGNLDLTDISAPDAVYFNLLGSLFVHYPMWLSHLFAAAALLAFLATLIRAVRSRCASVAGMLKATALLLGILLICAGLSAALAFTGYGLWHVYVLYRANALFTGMVLGTLGIMFAAVRRIDAKSHTLDYALAGLTLWAAILAVTAIGFPGAAGLFTWPLLGACLAVDTMARYKEHPLMLRRTLLLGLTAAPAVLLVVPTLLGAFTALTVIFAPALVTLLCLTLGLLTPQVAAISRGIRPAAGLLAVAALPLVVAGLWPPSFTPERPRMDFLSYAMDADTGQAAWISDDEGPDEWSAQFFPQDTTRQPFNDFLSDDPQTYLRAPARLLQVDPPDITLLADETREDVRRLTLHCVSARRAPRMMLYVEEDTVVHAAYVNGRLLNPSDGPWSLSYDILPPDGFEIELEVDPGQPLTIKAVDRSYALPIFPDTPLAPRPPHIIPKPNTLDFNKGFVKTDETLVSKSFVF